MDFDKTPLNSDDEDNERTEIYTPPPIDATIDYPYEEKENFPSPDFSRKEIISSANFEENERKISEFPLDRSPDDEFCQKRNFDLENDMIFWEPCPVFNEDFDSNREIVVSPKEIRKETKENFSPKKKTKKKKKSMIEYRAPSPFSPKPDYKSMDINQLKQIGMRYGLSTGLSKGRFVKILDEIYDFTHQYETDSDFEFEPPRIEKKDLLRTPPTPSLSQISKKIKKRPPVHQISSSDENERSNEENQSSDSDLDHQGRFLEMTVYELSTSNSSQNSSNNENSPNLLQDLPDTDSKISPVAGLSQKTSARMKKSKSENENAKKKKAPKLEKPSEPLKEILRNYIESDENLHGRILCYEPVDFEEFHKKMKTDLNLRIDSKELMKCLDDQCITFTLRSRKNAFSTVMKAKRRQK